MTTPSNRAPGNPLEGHHSGRVAWGETDASGRIHYSAAWRWSEIAEHQLFRVLQPNFPAARFPRKTLESTFYHPLAFDDPFDVRLWIDGVGRTSLTLEWVVTSGDRRCIEGRVVVVYIDERGRPTLLPEWLTAAALPY